MWIGRGLWFDMDIYSRFEREFGAVFVWSMYLAIAADGYVRYGEDSMRTLAARFAGMTDQLYAPGWAEGWYVKEALNHGVDGVVHLVADDVPGAHFTTEALEAAGIRVLEVRANNADPRSTDPAAFSAAIGDFLSTARDLAIHLWYANQRPLTEETPHQAAGSSASTRRLLFTRGGSAPRSTSQSVTGRNSCWTLPADPGNGRRLRDWSHCCAMRPFGAEWAADGWGPVRHRGGMSDYE